MLHLAETATALSLKLSKSARKIVFAESCTGGMVACELAKIAGASEWLCGSFVTYRSSAKVEWLGVDPDAIKRHTAVSLPVAKQMAVGALNRCPEADIAVSITGHLGPTSPEGLDGVVFIALADRGQRTTPAVSGQRHRLESIGRPTRQIEATQLVLENALRSLDP